MKKCSESKKIRPIILVLTLLVTILGGYVFTRNEIYRSIKVTNLASSVIEYGSANYNIKKLIKTNGKIVSIKNDIDAYELGKQKVSVVVAKGSIEKEIDVSIEVIDTNAPVIDISQDNISITQGDELNLLDNISVYDKIDGFINYSEEKVNGTYTINTNLDRNTVGAYDVAVLAVDKNGNEASSTFTVTVNKRNLSDGILRTAYSLIGVPYLYGGSTPSGFDCSGFVQYVYRQNGFSISRSAPTQINDGRAVSYEDMLPGDILVWGYDINNISHTAIYVGDNKMIHSTHPGEGVLVSNIDYWKRGSGTSIVGIRRVG